jgi:drug/metabolite transporter (DMT)-like permease
MTGRERNRRALALMFAATLMWPMLEHSGVSIMDTHHALQVVFLRYTGHLIVLLPFVLLRYGPAALRTERRGLQLLRGALMFGMPTCFVLGRALGPPIWVWTLFWTMPLMAVVGAILLLRERPHVPGLVAAALGAFGAYAIMGGPRTAGATIFGLGMGASMAGYMILTRVLREEPLATSLFYTAVGALLPTAAVVWRVWQPIGAPELLIMLVMGVFSVLILGAFDLALEAGRVGLVVPVLAIVPVWEAAWTGALRHALPGTVELGGVAVILFGFTILLALRGSTAWARQAADVSGG